jgi:membrane fusion protein, multidrug efflux system
VLTTIVSLDPVYVYFEADERTYLRYGAMQRNGERNNGGNPVRVALAGEQGFPHEGVLDFMDNQVNPSTGTIRARAVLLEPRAAVHSRPVRTRAAAGRRQRKVRCWWTTRPS